MGLILLEAGVGFTGGWQAIYGIENLIRIHLRLPNYILKLSIS